MPSKLSRSSKRIIKDMLLKFAGHKCVLCGAWDVFLDVDHIDGNPANDHPSNFRLLCHSCNVKEAIRDRGVKSEKERARKDATTVMKEKVNYASGSPEMQANEYGEPTFRDYVLRKVSNDGDCEKAALIKSGAEASGMQVVTCRNYMDKLTSDEGPLREFKPKGGGKTRVEFRPKYKEWSKW